MAAKKKTAPRAAARKAKSRSKKLGARKPAKVPATKTSAVKKQPATKTAKVAAAAKPVFDFGIRRTLFDVKAGRGLRMPSPDAAGGAPAAPAAVPMKVATAGGDNGGGDPLVEEAKFYCALHVINGYSGFEVTLPEHLEIAIYWDGSNDTINQQINNDTNIGGQRAPQEVQNLPDVGLKWGGLSLEVMLKCATRGELLVAIMNCYSV